MFIDSLLLTGGPSHIAGFVVAIDIRKAIQRHSGRTLSGISQEVFKIVPSLTHFDSATAPESIVPDRRILAALEHAEPARIGRGVLAVSGVAMHKAKSIFSLFLKQATAAFRVARRERVLAHNLFGSAIASAQP